MLAKSSRKDRRLHAFFAKHSLAEYFEAFLEKKISYHDLEFLESDDVEGIFTTKFHERRFLKCVNTLGTSKSPKRKGESCVKKDQVKMKSKSKKKEEVVHVHVKFKQKDEKIYDIPVKVSNEELIGKLLQAFLECEVKLPGEKIILVKNLKSFTLRNWVEKNELPPGEMIKAFLSAEGGVMMDAGVPLEEAEKLKSENERLKKEKEMLEKKIWQIDGETRVRLKEEAEKLRIEEERVHMFVKCKQEVRKIYEVPVNISNEELIGKLLQAFLECELKLQDEEIALVKELKSFTLKDWKEKNELSPGKMLRAVLGLKGAVLKTGAKGEEVVEKLRAENTEVKCKLEEVEKEMERVQKEADAKGLENKRLEKNLEKVRKEATSKVLEKKSLQKSLKSTENAKNKLLQGMLEKDNAIKKLEKRIEKLQKEAKSKGLENEMLKRELEKALMESTTKSKKLEELAIAEKKKKKKMEQPGGTVPKGFKSQRGILVPRNVVFEVNEMWRSRLEKVFSNGNKVAKGFCEFSCFKTSAVFTAGKKFYFQVSAKVGSGNTMGFGILSGEVTTGFVGGHEKGWDYNCYTDGTKRTYHNKKASRGYGPERTKGKHIFGIFCDFTEGKGEVSFIVNGKNWGVAYKNVKPPVSPAFYIWQKQDSFKIVDSFEVPGCI